MRSTVIWSRRHANDYSAEVLVDAEGALFASCIPPFAAIDAELPETQCESVERAKDLADQLAHNGCTPKCEQWLRPTEARSRKETD
jgi:hypothetical protein